MTVKVVETLYESNARQIPEMLRMSADNIEKEVGEDYSPTRKMIAVQMCENGDVRVYGWGDVQGNMEAIGILHTAIAEIARMQLGIPAE